MLIKKAKSKLPPRTMPKRMTAIFNGGQSDAMQLLRENAIGDAMVRQLGPRVAIQHSSLDDMSEGDIEDVCFAAQLPLEIATMCRDFRDLGPGLNRVRAIATA